MTSGISAFYRGDSIGAQRLAELKRHIENESGWYTLKVADEIGKIPLDFHPGEGWFYGQSMDVAGAIVEAVSGKKLGVFLDEEIFSPLGMDDTAFFVPLSQRNRLCGFFQQSQYVAGRDLSMGGENSLEPVTLRRYEIPFIPPEFEQGGDGLLSTPLDYMRFMNMLLDGQKSDSRRILQPESLRLLTEPRIPIKGIPLLEGYSYGFGLRILREPGILWRKGEIGEYGWYGHGGSWCCAERKTGITAIFFTQLLPSPHLEVIPELYNHLFS
jgi:CubicO group peptidase (beta-lactamase class C family)